MKFVCDRCSTRYSISDEKVAGKVLKIRCKTCGNIIVVREQGVTSQAAEQASQSSVAAAGGSRGPAPRTELDLGTTAPAGQSASGVEWFVAIKGKQHGPMSQDEVSNLYRQGKITARSYCWNEGLSGWVRLRELPDFQPLISAGPGPAPAPKAPPPPPDDAGAEVVDLQQRRAERQAATGDHPNPAAAGDPFAAVTSGVPSAAANQAPRESTRVFIMNAGLANRSRKHRIYAAVATVAVLLMTGLLAADFYGYIEIPLLHNVVTYAAETAGVEEPEKRKTKRIVSDLSEDELMALKCQLSPNQPECIALRERLAKKNRRRAARRSGTDGLDLGDGTFDGLDGAFQTGGGDSDDLERTRLTAADIDKIKGSDPELAKKLAGMLKGDGPKRTVRDRVAPTLKEGEKTSAPPIPAATISQVFGNNMSAVQSCVTQALKRGEKIPAKEKLSVRILPKGTVGRARLKNPVTNASPLGQCITKAAKRMKFPPFAGEAFDVDSPLILGGG